MRKVPKAPKQKFNIGDTVRLRSGGPVMTVHAIHPEQSDVYSLIWFDGGRRDGALFSAATIERASPNPVHCAMCTKLIESRKR